MGVYFFYIMSIKTLQDILPLVEQPSRYLGNEINSVRKDHDSVRLKAALVFPDLYEIGMSHFGLQILYHVLNSDPDIVAERVFAPAVDMEARLRSHRVPLTSLESGKPLARFDMIGFSLLYEMNYTNVLTILDLAGIPFYSAQRDDTHPVVIAGGPCCCNPEPTADFFDAMVIGDGEEVILRMARDYIRWKAAGDGKKKTLLTMWSDIPGVYVPSFFDPVIGTSEFQSLVPLQAGYSRIRRTVVSDLDTASFPDSPILPYARPIHDRLRLEVARGCSRGCRFCQAGMIYRPVRERSVDTLTDIFERSIASTGYEDVSLLSLSTGDYGCIGPLLQQIMRRYSSEHVSVSMPSLRAGTLTPEMMRMIKQVRKTGFTIAPEAGSARLRDVINKNISADDIFRTVEDAFRLGWQLIKLYFMVGQPTETDDDLDAIVELVRELRRIRPPRGKGNINVSVSTLIPKPHTPFQWASQICLEESRRKINGLKDRLRMPGVHFKWQNPEVSLMEGLWSRGDRRLSRLLVNAYGKGCRFDGWSDKFRFDFWQEALADESVDIDFFTTRTRCLKEPLPWDHIDMGVKKAFLQKEWDRAHSGQTTPDCRNGDCQACGVCDFDRVRPRTFEGEPTVPLPVRNEPPPETYKKVRLVYSRLGPARYFGHLELVSLFIRALHRAGIRLKFSGGFHPMPKISFDDPLPVGMESHKEIVNLTVTVDTDPAHLVQKLNRHLPEGLEVHACEPQASSSRKTPRTITYEITLHSGAFDESRIAAFEQAVEMTIHRINRKGKSREIDLRSQVADIRLNDARALRLSLKCDDGPSIRPSEVIGHVFGLAEEQIRRARFVKLGTVV